MRSAKPANHIDSTGKTKKKTGLTCFKILPEEKYIECTVCMNPLYENVDTPNCNNVVIEKKKKQKAKKPNRNKLAMLFTFAYFNSVFNNYLRIHSQ